jgi:hypothetical protein
MVGRHPHPRTTSEASQTRGDLVASKDLEAIAELEALREERDHER